MMVHYFHTALIDVSLAGIALFNVARPNVRLCVAELFNAPLFDVAPYHVALF